jgi:hypothetical protein
MSIGAGAPGVLRLSTRDTPVRSIYACGMRGGSPRWSIGVCIALARSILLLAAPLVTLFPGDAYFMFGQGIR